jgi:hypothetical protein
VVAKVPQKKGKEPANAQYQEGSTSTSQLLARASDTHTYKGTSQHTPDSLMLLLTDDLQTDTTSNFALFPCPAILFAMISV